MAFRSLKNFNPFLNTVDPRIDSSKIVNSSYCVLAISQYPTFDDTVKKGLANSLKILGLISGYNVNESIAVSHAYEVGNKKCIIIPGKFRGSMSISSGIVESINLLGSIYETVLDGLNEKYGDIFQKPLTDEILFRPTLNKTYFDNPNNDGTFDPSGGLNEQGIQLAQYYGIDDEYLVDPANPAFETKEVTDKGAILLSLDDMRLRVKFGIAFIMFQSETRIPENSLGFSEIEKVQAFGINNTIDNPGILGDLPGGPLSATNYKILGGQFYENCIILDYNRSVNTEPVGSNINESISLMYNGTRRLKRNLSEDFGTSISLKPEAA